MVDFTKVPPLDWQTPIVDPKTGQPSAQFIRLWQTTFQNAEGTEAGLASKVTGPTASTDNAIARYDGITGKLLKDSGVTISDAGEIEGVTELITPSGFLTVTSPLIYLQGQGIWIVSPFDYDGNFRLINTNQDWLVGMLGSPGARNFEIYDATRNAYVLTIRQSDGMFVAATGVEVPDSAYSGTWNGNVSVPTKNAVYDALEQRVPAGGTTGQVLGKASATDYDVDWIDQSGGGGGGGGTGNAPLNFQMKIPLASSFPTLVGTGAGPTLTDDATNGLLYSSGSQTVTYATHTGLSGDFTVTARINPNVASGNTNSGTGICLYDSGANKTIAWVLYRTGAGTFFLGSSRWTGTTYNAATFSDSTGFGAFKVFWLRIRVVSGVGYFEHSTDGAQWVTFNSYTLSSHMSGTNGAGLFAFSSGAEQFMRVEWYQDPVVNPNVTGIYGGGSIPLTLDTGSVSTTRFLSGMSTYELTIPSTVPLVDGSVLRVRMTYKKPLTKDRGIVLAIGTSNGYGVKHQADHNKVVYRYNGGTETAKTTLGTTNDASVGTHYIEFEIMIADIAVGRHRLSGAVDFYVNQSMTSNPGNNSDNSVAMIGNLRIFAITDSTSDFVKATLEVLL